MWHVLQVVALIWCAWFACALPFGIAVGRRLRQLGACYALPDAQ